MPKEMSKIEDQYVRVKPRKRTGEELEELDWKAAEGIRDLAITLKKEELMLAIGFKGVRMLERTGYFDTEIPTVQEYFRRRRKKLGRSI